MITHIPCGVNTLNLPPDLVDQVAALQTLLLRKAVRLGDTKPASRKDVARHEAGHAVIAVLLGVKLRCCWIKQEHGVWGGYTEPDEPASWFILLPNAKQRVYTPIGCLARAYFGLAGPLAERQQGRGVGPANLAVDLPELIGVFEALWIAIVMAMFPDHQPTTDEELAMVSGVHMALMQRLELHLQAMLQAETARITKIATQLQQRGHLTTHQTSALLHGIWPIDLSATFDQLRQGLPVGPLPKALPPVYLEAALEMEG
ncbi:hypothetical protein [Teichococcus oryzae]|uniref:Peptidase M41 domain-containing protein n=1 Tax=Teichococcus oryzae TaxID=1608942 RepID=A0A5B2TC02_9PROT|nr:hypothetical protein [Pseudoroseomonas oryzae]KAA2211368.1 hypothetical protein F0Q34_20510 [Pseudoroseomonas oryzae]